MIIVAKTGGRVIEHGVPLNLVKDIAQTASNHSLFFVHGGGVEVTDIAKKMGKPQQFVMSPKGFRSRYTDKDTAEIYTMVMVGKLNSEIVLQLESHGIPAVGLSGLDGRLLQAERKKRLIILDERGRRRVIDGGYTGQITKVNTTLLQLISKQYIPVIAPVALSEEFEPLNVDGDRSAAHIAGALKADRLVLLTDVDGLMVNKALVPELTSFEAKALLPKIGPGMITKIYAALEAIEKGVEEVVISSGFNNKPISSAINHEQGTVIRNV